MYRGYVIESISNDFAQQHLIKGRDIVEKDCHGINQDLESYTGKDGGLDAELLSDNWFPKIKADIFISHSHLDRELAHGLVGWLDKEFGLKAFVDPLVWNSADALLNKIDRRYCWQEDRKLFDYKKRNLSTSHVHMMLAMSIAHMIDNCECVLFLSTPSSVSPRGTIEDKSQTSSPRIFAEILLTKLIRIKPPKGRREKDLIYTKESLESISMGRMEINHPLDLSHLYRICEDDLNNWQQDFSQKKDDHPLDVLYHLTRNS